MPGKKIMPVIRVAPAGDLNAYTVYEFQLDQLAQGSPASLILNFALFFLGTSVTALGTLWSATPTNDRIYYTFLVLFLTSTIAGVVLIALWYRLRAAIRPLLNEIKSQMPSNPSSEGDPTNVGK